MVLLTSVIPGLVFLSGVLVGSTHGWEKIGNGAAVLAFAVLGVRTAMLGIFAWPEQLVVHDYFRTYRIRWSEIASFEMPPRYGTWRKSRPEDPSDRRQADLGNPVRTNAAG